MYFYLIDLQRLAMVQEGKKGGDHSRDDILWTRYKESMKINCISSGKGFEDVILLRCERFAMIPLNGGNLLNEFKGIE